MGDDVISRVEDWLAGMRVDQALALTNRRYADLWALITLAKAGKETLDRLSPNLEGEK